VDAKELGIPILVGLDDSNKVKDVLNRKLVACKPTKASGESAHVKSTHKLTYLNEKEVAMNLEIEVKVT
jgi:hypothetical protein